MSKLITISENDLRDVLAAAFGRGCAFWNIHRPKDTLDFKDKMTREKLSTIEDFMKFVLDQERLRNAMENRKGEA